MEAALDDMLGSGRDGGHHGLLSDPVGLELERLAADLGVTCLLEGADGRVISHALLASVPPCVADAVLARDASALHRARGPVRQVRLAAAGPVLQATLTGWDGIVCIIPLPAHGWLWLLCPDVPPLTHIEALVEPLQQALSRISVHATDEALMERLTQAPNTMHAVVPDQRVMVVKPVRTPVGAAKLDSALRSALQGLRPASCTATCDRAYVLLRSSTEEQRLQAQLSSAVRRAGSTLGVALCAVVSPAGLSPAHARELAEQALDAMNVPNECVSVDACRPHILLPRLTDVTRRTWPSDVDPVTVLDDTLASTLLAWLNHHGDAAAAASAQGVHPNTVRYRLKSAQKLLTTNLDDPVARIALHLRLIDRCQQQLSRVPA